jgi:hypothetical protein
MRARARATVSIIIAANIFIAGCGGRVARPVAITTPYDSQLDCDHLAAEKTVNAARARDLAGEQNNDVKNDIGFLLFSPLFVNLSGTEQTELRAYAARETVLNKIMAGRCPAPASGNAPSSGHA